MSGLALIMKGQGFKVQGSDIVNNKNIERLKKEKIKIYLGHSKKNLKYATIAVISSAIKKSNPELIEAKRRKINERRFKQQKLNEEHLEKNAEWRKRRLLYQLYREEVEEEEEECRFLKPTLRTYLCPNFHNSWSEIEFWFESSPARGRAALMAGWGAAAGNGISPEVLASAAVKLCSALASCSFSAASRDRTIRHPLEERNDMKV